MVWESSLNKGEKEIWCRALNFDKNFSLDLDKIQRDIDHKNIQRDTLMARDNKLSTSSRYTISYLTFASFAINLDS